MPHNIRRERCGREFYDTRTTADAQAIACPRWLRQRQNSAGGYLTPAWHGLAFLY
jgi:hypothetical protein